MIKRRHKLRMPRKKMRKKRVRKRRRKKVKKRKRKVKRRKRKIKMLILRPQKLKLALLLFLRQTPAAALLNLNPAARSQTPVLLALNPNPAVLSPSLVALNLSLAALSQNLAVINPILVPLALLLLPALAAKLRLEKVMMIRKNQRRRKVMTKLKPLKINLRSQARLRNSLRLMGLFLLKAHAPTAKNQHAAPNLALALHAQLLSLLAQPALLQPVLLLAAETHWLM